jgi:hypothetical protein
MNPDTVPFKTPLGQSEIARQSALQSRTLRNVLLLVDGKRDLRTLQSMMQAISAPPDAIEQLLALGLIAAPEPPAANALAAPGSDGSPHDDGFGAERAADSRGRPEPEDAAAAFSSLYRKINAVVSSHLGMIKAYGIQLKVEQCQSADELLALLPEIKSALVAKHGEAKAVALLRQLET